MGRKPFALVAFIEFSVDGSDHGNCLVPTLAPGFSRRSDMSLYDC